MLKSSGAHVEDTPGAHARGAEHIITTTTTTTIIIIIIINNNGNSNSYS